MYKYLWIYVYIKYVYFPLFITEIDCNSNVNTKDKPEMYAMLTVGVRIFAFF